MDVKAWREAHGLTQRRLAQLLDVDQMTVSRWERGERKPRGRVLELALERLSEKLSTDEEPTTAKNAATGAGEE